MASSQSKFYGVLALILVIGAALIAFTIVKDRQAPAVGATESTVAVGDDELVSAEVGVSRGADDAPVLIEEYADYQCPACGMVGTLTIPQIMENYVDTGKARFVFYDFPLRPGASELGAQAARCAGDQDAFWPMQKVLLGRMREWGRERNPVGLFRQYAEALRLDGKALSQCVESEKYRDVVLASGQRARQLGIGQTPTFYINGRQAVGAMGYDQMAAIIEEELAKQ